MEAPDNDVFDLMVRTVNKYNSSKSWNSLKIPANGDASLDIVHKIIVSAKNLLEDSDKSILLEKL